MTTNSFQQRGPWKVLIMEKKQKWSKLKSSKILCDLQKTQKMKQFQKKLKTGRAKSGIKAKHLFGVGLFVVGNGFGTRNMVSSLPTRALSPSQKKGASETEKTLKSCKKMKKKKKKKQEKKKRKKNRNAKKGTKTNNEKQKKQKKNIEPLEISKMGDRKQEKKKEAKHLFDVGPFAHKTK